MVSINPNFGSQGVGSRRGVETTTEQPPVKPETTVQPLIIYQWDSEKGKYEEIYNDKKDDDTYLYLDQNGKPVKYDTTKYYD